MNEFYDLTRGEIMKIRNTIWIAMLLMALLYWGCRNNKLQVYETIQEAVEKGDIKDVKRHLKRGANVNAKTETKNVKGLTLLHVAAGNGNKDMVELLIAKGATVNAKASDEITPLYWAMVNFFQEVIGDQKEVVELLIAKGADVNAKERMGFMPLHIAAISGQKDMVNLLIAKGAIVNGKSSKGIMPLHYAAEHGQKDVAGLLIANGADVNAKDDGGLMPLHYAAAHRLIDWAESGIAIATDDSMLLDHIEWPSHNDVAELLPKNWTGG